MKNLPIIPTIVCILQTITYGTSDSTEPNEPITEQELRYRIHQEVENHKAHRRDSENNTAQFCQRVGFYSDLNAFSYNITRRSIVEVGYCDFSCDFDYSLDQLLNDDPKLIDNHAKLRRELRQAIPDLEIPEPCCIPLTFEPITLKVKENDKVIDKEFTDLVALDCGCR